MTTTDTKLHVLYLDFDGVLHPLSAEYAIRRSATDPATRDHFESCPILIDLLSPYRELKIVLSTSWVKTYGFEQTRDLLPLPLAARVIGSTYVPRTDGKTPTLVDYRARFEEIHDDVMRRKPDRWLAIDDDQFPGWSQSMRERHAAIMPWRGLADPGAQEHLRQQLSAQFAD